MWDRPGAWEVTLERLARTINRATDSVGKALPGMLRALVRLNLLAFFFWYAWELLWEASSHSPASFAAVLIAVSAILILVFSVLVFIAVLPGEWTRIDPVPVRGSILPFIVLLLIPIAIIVIVSRWGPYKFSQPLSSHTAYHAGRLIYWVANLW